MRKLTLFILFLVYAVAGNCTSKFENEYNHASHIPIKKFAVIGERCSGTNFLNLLLAKNTSNLAGTSEYGWKHFFPWLDLPEHKLVNHNPSQLDFLSDSDDCLFIYIVRNKYDWVRSFYKTPYHMHSIMRHKGLFHFISHQWVPDNSKTSDVVNPYRYRRFRDIVELRHFKTLNSLEIGKSVKNFMFVRYEDLNESPEEFVNFLAKKFNLERTPKFIPHNNHKYSKRPYKKKKYPNVDKKCYKFLNKSVAKLTDALLGYENVSRKHVNE